jgi:hypothetical protein
MRILSFLFFVGLLQVGMTSCGAGKTKSQEGSDKEISDPENPVPATPFLTAAQLIDLAVYKDLSGIQLFMKENAPGFVHGKKGEFASLQRTGVTDTAGVFFELPATTLYVSTDPQEDWRVAHTIHTDSLRNVLLTEFKAKQFVLSDSAYDKSMQAKTYIYQSVSLPDITLLYTTTFKPWPSKGLYVNRITWPCYVFQVLKAN